MEEFGVLDWWLNKIKHLNMYVTLWGPFSVCFNKVHWVHYFDLTNNVSNNQRKVDLFNNNNNYKL